jgi:hypothetical protein
MSSDLFNNDMPSGGGYGGTYKSKPRCHTTHKPIKLGMGEIVGAACGSPREGYDIYIGFDYGMKMQHQPFPWDQKDDPIIEFQYRITDMCAPKSPKEFKKMIEWVSEQLDDGKKIHVGCIGGHGRTGLFLAALVSLYEDLTDDPIGYVRKEHCKKAVESKSQMKFLKKHFGISIKGHKPTKEHGHFHHTGTQTGRMTGKAQYNSNVTQIDRKRAPEKIRHVAKKGSIWG